VNFIGIDRWQTLERPTCIRLIGLSFANSNAFSILPEDEREALLPSIQKHIERIIDEQGIEVFLSSPRSTALAHEVGHAIVGTHDNIGITAIEIYTKPAMDGRAFWCGWTTEAATHWSTGPDTPIPEALSRICYIVAGEAAEGLLDPDNYRRNASSLDEIVLAQRLCLDFAEAVQLSGEDLFNYCYGRTRAIIKHNAALAQKLIERLDKTEILHRRKPRSLLNQVQKLPKDWPSDAAEWPARSVNDAISKGWISE
jgi:hypothetical protein